MNRIVSRESPVERLRRKARRQRIITPHDVKRARIPRSALYRLVDRGELERISRGVYRLPSEAVTEHHSLALVAARVPTGIICLLSALRFHDMTTLDPPAVWLGVSRNSHSPHIAEVAVEVVRLTGHALTAGIDRHSIEGVPVKITSPARTVVDCFRFRSKVGIDVAIDALKSAVFDRRCTPAELAQLARLLRVRTVMAPYLEFIAAL